MKNIIVFDVRGECWCVCVANILETGVNNIILTFEADAYSNPKFEIKSSTGESKLYSLTVVSGVATGEFNWNEILQSENSYCQMHYVDNDKIGKWFNWQLPTTTTGGIDYKSLRVYKENNTTFLIKFIASQLTPVSSANPNDFDVDENGVVSLKNVSSINVVKNSNKKIGSIEFIYENGTSETCNCTYNSGGDLTAFGSITIDWG